MTKNMQNKLKTKIVQKNKINSSYILLINSLKKNNSELEEEINNINNNIDYLLYYNNNFSKKNVNNKKNTTNNLKLIKEKLEEQILNSNYNQEEIICLSYITTKINKNGFLTNDINELIKEIDYLQNIKITKKKLEDYIKILQNISKIGICTKGINDFLKYQILLIFSQKKINENQKNILLNIVNYVNSANLNFAIQKFIKTNDFLNLNINERKFIIETFLNLKTYPINNINNFKQKENFEIENYKDNVDFFIYTNNQNDLEIKINEVKIPENLITTLKNLENEINNFYNNNKNNKRYENIENTNESEKYIEYIKKKHDFIKKYLEILNQRNEKLLAIITIIINKQKKYLISGDEKFLKPLKLEDISKKTKIPISTISRIVSKKRLQTDFGIISLKQLFIKSVSNQKKLSTISLMIKIKDIISKNNNITDSQIVEIFKKKNIIIARRTINKYRNMLKINNSYIRKYLNNDF